MTLAQLALGTAANDGTGDDLRTAGGKINTAFGAVDAITAYLLRQMNVTSVAAIGDSWADAISLAPNTFGATAGLNWADVLSFGRFDIIGEFGVSGLRSDQLEAQFQSALATKAGTLYISCQLANNIGQNYPTAGTSGATGAADLISLATRWTAAGGQVLLELPIGTSGFSATQLAQVIEARQRIREYADRNPRVFLHDCWSLFVPDSSTSAVAWKPNYNYDQTHANNKGGYYHGKSLLPVINAMFGPRFEGFYNAVENVANGRWNLSPNPVLRTISGGTSGTGMTGTTAGSCVTGRTGAATANVSVIADATYTGQKQRLDTTFTALGETVTLAQDVNIANWNPGEIVQGMALVSIPNPSAFVAAPYVVLTSNGDSASVIAAQLFPATTSAPYYPGVDEAVIGLLRTPKLTIPNYTTKGYLSVAAKMMASAAGAAILDVYNLGVRRCVAL